MMPTDEAINVLLEDNVGVSLEWLKLTIMLGNFVSCFSVFAGGAGIFIAIWYFKRHSFRFSPWYILWFSLLLIIFIIISAIACIPFFVYSIVQLLPKRKKV